MATIPCASCAYRRGAFCPLHDEGVAAFGGGCSGGVWLRRRPADSTERQRLTPARKPDTAMAAAFERARQA